MLNKLPESAEKELGYEQLFQHSIPIPQNGVIFALHSGSTEVLG